MPALYSFVVRRDDKSSSSPPGLTPATTNLLIALVVLFAAVAILVGILLILRQMRRTRKEQEQRAQEALPMYSEKPAPIVTSRSGSRLTIRTSHYGSSNEKQHMLVDSPTSVPEIRITFPEEVDESGKRTSGRVVVVKVGEHSVGLEPVHDEEQLPPYQQTESAARFQSLDLDRIGGLKEKEMR